MKKLCIFLLLVFLIQLVNPLCSMAEPTDSSFRVTVYDTGGEWLPLKEYPNHDSNSLDRIPEDTLLLIDQTTDDGWGHTSSYFGRSGWVYLHNTRIFGEYHVQYPSYGFITPAYYGVIGTGGEGLEFRTQPTSECSTFGPLCDESLLYVQAIQGEWAFAFCNGQFGWVNMAYLLKLSDKRGYRVTVYDTGNDGLEFKTGAGSNSELLSMVPEGTIIGISDVTPDGWGYTSYNGSYGWIRLRNTKIYEGYPMDCPLYGYTEPAYYTIYNTGEKGLELRCRPTEESSTFGPIADGTDVKVLAIQDSWAFVYYDWKYGWCNLDYMKETNNQDIALNNAEMSDGFELSLLLEQVKEVLSRYNYMDSHGGCATFSMERATPDEIAALESSDPGIGSYTGGMSVYKYLDCHTIDEVMEQRREYFSDEIFWPGFDFSQSLIEYDGNVYFLRVVADSNCFILDDAHILYADDNGVVVPCAREAGGSLYRYLLKFSYEKFHLKLISMDIIF